MMSYSALRVVKEFYALEAIRILSEPEQFRKSHERWLEDFNRYQDIFVTKFEQAIYDYTVLVCGGEIRHCRNRSNEYNPHLNCKGTDGRTYSYGKVKEYTAESIIKSSCYLFEIPWESGYGGLKWRSIIELVEKRHAWGGKALFIDHAVDLSHNNSPYFDKSDSNIFHIDDKHEYLSFLDLKREASPKRVIEDVYMSHELALLTLRARNLGIIPSNIYFLEDHPNGDSNWAISFILGYKPIEWGKRELPFEFEKTGYEYRHKKVKTETFIDEDDEDEDDEDCEVEEIGEYPTPPLSYHGKVGRLL